jgi:hypothetical protein
LQEKKMTAQVVEKNSTEKREKRARSIAAMGLVNREGDRFKVSTPSLRGRQTAYEVWRDADNRIRCNCLEFEEAAVSDSGFRCEHILAVKYALITKNSEPVTKQAQNDGAVSEDKSASESREMSARGEQKTEEVSTDVSENGQTEAVEAKPIRLANTQGDEKMTKNNLKEMPFITAGEADRQQVEEQQAANNNVLEFSSTLRALSKTVDPNLVKQREGWRDRNGNTHYVDYVEWHTVADILDQNAPSWTHAVKDIRQIGDIMTVTVAITIDGVTREGIGTGMANTELGIKKAEHDALKRAAVKFGIARELYKKESDVIEREGAVPVQQEPEFPANPIAKSLSDLVTAKQLGMIRAIAREIGIDPDEECNSVMQCRTDELSKRAASSFIQHLQDMQKESSAEAPLRRAS